MVSISDIKEEDRELIRELFHEGNSVYVSSTAKFEINGDTIKCLSSLISNPDVDEHAIENELRILRIKEISEGIGYKFIDNRGVINN